MPLLIIAGLAAVALLEGCYKRDKGRDCEEGDHKDKNTVSVGDDPSTDKYDGDCTALQYAVDSLDPANSNGFGARIQLYGDRGIPATSVISGFKDLTIQLHPDATTVATLDADSDTPTGSPLLDIQDSLVTIDGCKEDGSLCGLFIEGGGEFGAISVSNTSKVSVSQVDYTHLAFGVDVRDTSEYDGAYNYFDILLGSAISASDQTIVKSEYETINCDLRTSITDPAINIAGSDQATFYGAHITQCVAFDSVVALAGTDLNMLGSYLHDNESDSASLLEVAGGQPLESGIPEETEAKHYFEANVVANNIFGDGGLVVADASGDIAFVNNILAYNKSASGGAGTLVDLSQSSNSGITTFVNNIVIGNKGLSSAASLVTYQINDPTQETDPFTSDHHNIYEDNDGQLRVANSDLNQNLSCDPQLQGDDMFEPGAHYLNPREFQPADNEENRSCAIGTGDPYFPNPGENESDRGAFGGSYLTTLEAAIATMCGIDWFREGDNFNGDSCN